jgi:hypothetical protein
MEDPVNKGAELENLPQPPTDGVPPTDEKPAEKLGGGSRDHKPDHKPPGKPPKPDPALGGGSR